MAYFHRARHDGTHHPTEAWMRPQPSWFSDSGLPSPLSPANIYTARWVCGAALEYGLAHQLSRQSPVLFVGQFKDLHGFDESGSLWGVGVAFMQTSVNIRTKGTACLGFHISCSRASGLSSMWPHTVSDQRSPCELCSCGAPGHFSLP